MSLSVLASLPVPPVTGGQVSFSPFVTYLSAPLNPGTVALSLPPNIEQDLYAVLGNDKYAMFVVNDGLGSEGLNLYFISGVLTVIRAPGGTVSYPAGSCLLPLSAGARGIQGIQGTQGTQGTQGIQGANGTNGTNGTNSTGGADGSVWYFGTAAVPAASLGTNIDKYLNSTTGDVFEKISGTWVASGVMKGAPGPAGASGADGSHWESGAGVPLDTFGSDGWLYVNSINGDVYKKTAGHWAWNMNIAGAQGIPGNNGTPGSRWFFGTAAPTAAIGTNLDYYLEINSADWWQKSTGTWVIGGSLRGVPGTAGSDGAPGYSQSCGLVASLYTVASVAPNAYVNTTAISATHNTVTGLTVGAADITLSAGAYILALSGYIRVSYALAVPLGSSMYRVYLDGVYLTSTSGVTVAPIADGAGYAFFYPVSLNAIINAPAGGVVTFTVSHAPVNSGTDNSIVLATDMRGTILRIQ